MIWGLGIILLNSSGYAQELSSIFTAVEKLNISRNGYVLGRVLSPAQRETAGTYPVESTSEKTFKFKDGSLYVVADARTFRVLVMYEQFENISGEEIRKLTGTLFMDYEEPTVFAHDKIVYWAYGPTGKFSSREFDTAGKENKRLDILATIKLNSELEITKKGKESEFGSVYYIISSDPLLKFFQDKQDG